MELASMLAGEPFSDRPVSVCPAIGAFLRAYNDFTDDRRRQDLYRLAAAVVGTRSTSEVEMLRVPRVVEWGSAMRGSPPWHWLARTLYRVRAPGGLDPEEAGQFAIRAIGRKHRKAHPLALALVDELIAYGGPSTHIQQSSAERPAWGRTASARLTPPSGGNPYKARKTPGYALGT